jgi:hypothetical protein
MALKFTRDEYYFFWGLGKRSRELRKKIARFALPLVRKRMHRQLAVFPLKKNLFWQSLAGMIGDFSGFAVIADEDDGAIIVSAADEILAGYHNIFGSGRTLLRPINWHLDFKSGFAWPRKTYYLDLLQVDYANNADVKVPRELSRAHHFLLLGQAYLLTSDEKYAREFKDQVEDWIAENPLMYSINWGCAMDVAIRAVNWIYALNMFSDSPSIDDAFIRKTRLSLFEHGYFIFNNLEKKYRNSNNHYFANLAGLINLGLLFRDSRDGRRWLEFATKEFYSEIRYQFLPSGISYERSVSYNRLMVEMALYSYLTLVRNRVNVPLDIRHRVLSTFDFILHCTKPDGQVPVVGDQDNGRFLPFSIRPQTDHRYLLTIGAILKDDPLLKKNADGALIDAFFVLGTPGVERFRALPNSDETVASRAFPDAGFCVLRDRDRFMFVTNSGAAAYPDQTSQWGSHAHADLLSFELGVGETTFLVDPGTYLYTASPAERNRFRGSAMHNTVVVDGRDQHRLSESNIFRCLEIAEPVDFLFRPGIERDVFQGSHNGYGRMDEPVIHSRTIEFDKAGRRWEIIDRFSGRGRHIFQWHFHFASGIGFVIDNGRALTQLRGKTNLELAFSAGQPATWRTLNDFVSKAYGEKTPSLTLELEIEAECPLESRTVIRTID